MVCVMCLHTTWFGARWCLAAHSCLASGDGGVGGGVDGDPGVLQPVWQQVQWEEEEEEEEEKVEMGTGLGPKCCRWLTVPRVAWPSHQATLAMHMYTTQELEVCSEATLPWVDIKTSMCKLTHWLEFWLIAVRNNRFGLGCHKMSHNLGASQLMWLRLELISSFSTQAQV